MKYSELLTTKEAMRVFGVPYRSKLDQPKYGLSDKLGLSPVKVGDQRGFPIEKIEEGIRQHFSKPDEYREAYQRLIEIRRQAESKRDALLVEYADVSEAMDITGITTREGVYWHADFRGRSVHTIRFGHIRLFNVADLEKIARKRELRALSTMQAVSGGPGGRLT